MSPEDRKYSESHEWVQEENGTFRIGLTKHAVEELQDLVFLDLKEEGTELKKGDPFGEVESVKAVADMYSPVTGTIEEAHISITTDLDTLYEDPFHEGWLIRVKPSDKSELDDLMNRDEYEKHIAERE